MDNKVTIHRPVPSMGPVAIETLKNASVWVNYYIQPRQNGHPTKPPINPHAVASATKDSPRDVSLYMAKTDSPSTWADYNTARLNVEFSVFGLAGVGMVLQPGMVLIDADADDDGRISDVAVSIVRQFAQHTYCEKSPSGTGVHILCLVDLNMIPAECRCKNSQHGIELYVGGRTNRYATFTGNSISTVLDLTDCTQAVLQVIDRYFRDDKPQPQPTDRAQLDDHQQGVIMGWREKVNFFLTSASEAPPQCPKHLTTKQRNWFDSILKKWTAAHESDQRFASHWFGNAGCTNARTGKYDESKTDFLLMSDLIYRLGRDEQACIDAFLASPYCAKKDPFHLAKANRKNYLKTTFAMAEKSVRGTYTGDFKPFTMPVFHVSYKMNKENNDDE